MRKLPIEPHIVKGRANYMGEKSRIYQTDDYMKLEIAEELGLIEKVIEGGWSSLTAKESGRVGGLLQARKRKNKSQ